MKKQIKRLSPHQNGKVLGVMVALSMIPFIIIFMLLAMSSMPKEAPSFIPLVMFIIFPIFYLVMIYVMVLISCSIYNWTYKFVGGFEFEIVEQENLELTPDQIENV